jgi:hypothetical protein
MPLTAIRVSTSDEVIITSEQDGQKEQNRTGQDRRGEDRTGQDRIGQDRTGQDRTGQDRTGQDRTGQDRTGQEVRSSVVLNLTSSMSSPSSAMQVATSTLVSPRLNDCNAT